MNKAVRLTIAQKKSNFDINDIVANNKILIVNLSFGRLGEWTSSFLGAILITKIWQTMISQSSKNRKNNLYLFIDEFQNFATDSFTQIFSEARKYGLSVTVANQYINQIPENIRKALFGNVGSLISFRLGAEDARVMALEFAPIFNEYDFTNLNQKEIYMKISVEGITSPPFSAESLDLSIPELNFSNQIIYNSRS